MASATKTGRSGASTPTEGMPGSGAGENQSDGGLSGLADSAKQAAGQAASQAKDAVGNVVGQVKDEATARAEQQRHTIASSVEAVAQAVRNMGQELRNQNQGPIAGYAADLGTNLADRADQFARNLHGRDVRQLAGDLEGFARRSPGTFLGVSFVLGLVATRFLKSSRPASAPDLFANMPDPNRALPAPSTPPSRSTDLGQV